MTSNRIADAPIELKDPSLLREQCYIDGAWVGAGETVVDNPATGAELARVPNFGPAETTRAIAAAKAAIGPWAKRTAKERSGSRKVAVAWGTLDFTDSMDNGSVVVTLMRDQIRQSPEYKPDEPTVVLEGSAPSRTAAPATSPATGPGHNQDAPAR